MNSHKHRRFNRRRDRSIVHWQGKGLIKKPEANFTHFCHIPPLLESCRLSNLPTKRFAITNALSYFTFQCQYCLQKDSRNRGPKLWCRLLSNNGLVDQSGSKEGESGGSKSLINSYGRIVSAKQIIELILPPSEQLAAIAKSGKLRIKQLTHHGGVVGFVCSNFREYWES